MEIIKERKVKILLLFVGASILLIFFKGVSTGLDLQGGSVIQIQTERPLGSEEMEQVLIIMDERLRGGLGVRDVKVRPWGNEFIIIEIAGVRPEEAEKLIGKPGKLEVRIGNISVFTGEDLIRVDPYGYEPYRGSWGVPFSISEDAAVRFRDAAIETNFDRVYMYLDEGLEIRAYTLKEVEGLESKLEKMGLEGEISSVKGNLTVLTTIKMDLTLDELGEKKEEITNFINQTANLTDIEFIRTGLVNDAPIGQELQAELAAGRVVKSLVLEIGGREEDRLEARRIEAILKSGALPIKVNVVGSHGISATLGETFTRDAILAGIAAFIGISIFIYLRYREPVIVLPILATGSSEIIIILGAASLINWNIDLPAIAGIIAAVGTGMDNQIVIIDEVLMERERSMRYRIKSAFFIILGSYLTLLAAMSTLFVMGMAMLKGFAVTTIIGATAGIFITRPAYAKIIEHVVKRKIKINKRKKKRA
jgi:preprotein translocase subunit SecD